MHTPAVKHCPAACVYASLQKECNIFKDKAKKAALAGEVEELHFAVVDLKEEL